MSASNKEVRTIAILGSHISWDGGVDFLCYLVQSIESLKDEHPVKLYLVLPHHSISKLKTFVLQWKFILRNPSVLFDRKTRLFENKNLKLIKGFQTNNIHAEVLFYNYTNSDLIRKLQKVKADVLFPSIRSFGKNFPVPWVAYIPDLQHKHFPKNFSEEECASRDYKYQSLINDSKALFVNSLAARQDLIQYYSCNPATLFSLPFCPPEPLVEVNAANLQKVKQTYVLPERFFIISNQFWRHKSHITAFKALHELMKDGTQDVQLICTGKPYDDKDPDFIKDLFDQIKQLGLENHVRFLGFIPKEDQLLIMAQSIALIQPTLFEGGPGGGSVYNAISYGVTSIVSDIEINKEVKGDSIVFFEAGNSHDLMKKMQEVLNMPPFIPDQQSLYKAGKERTKELGRHLLRVLGAAVK